MGAINMPEIKPFQAIRYDHAKLGGGDAALNPLRGDVSGLISPPYDVLDQNDKDALLARSDHNFVALDLPHLPPKSAGADELYQRSARLLNEWLAGGTLVLESRPAIYLYHQSFEHAGRAFTRKMFVARVRLTPLDQGDVLAHEQTFGGPKEDRLALMKATKCQTSPILGMYTDPENRIDNAFSATASGEPDLTGTLNGVVNRMWIVTEQAVIDSVASTMLDKKIFIADGHHRYGTALLYKNYLAGLKLGIPPEDHPSNYIMFVLADMDDPGCLILPYHRVLTGTQTAAMLQAWSGAVEKVSQGEADLTLYEGASGERTPLRFTNRAVLEKLEPDSCDAWHRLDYAYLHRYLIDELLEKKSSSPPVVRYVKSEEQAMQTARDESGVGLLMNPTPMEILRGVSEAGGLMPQKSTFFYPKLATGLTIYPLS